MNISAEEFIGHLKKNGLVIAPRELVQENYQAAKTQSLRARLLRKKALTMKEISDGEIWGKISVKAVKEHAKKHARENELFQIEKMNTYKLIRSAVERIAKQRGQWEM